MQYKTKLRLKKAALALAVAGYCAVPSAIAAGESSGNLKSGSMVTTASTGAVNGTAPWIESDSTDKVKDHLKVTVDRSGRTGGFVSTDTSDINMQLHVGDKITVSWVIGDAEGDVDGQGAETVNAKTKATIKWKSYTDQSGGNASTIGTAGSDTYTITEADKDLYIGLDIEPNTTTGIPSKGTLINLFDLSSAAGGGSDSDDLPTGPVVDDSVKVMIYDAADPTVDLLTSSSVTLHTTHTYKVRFWKDADNDGVYDAGETDVTSSYDYRWVFTGNSAQDSNPVPGGDSTVSNGDLVIPATNAEATSIFSSAGPAGVQGYGLAIKYRYNK